MLLVKKDNPTFLLTLCRDHLRATSFAERLRLGLAVIHGEQKEPESERLDGRQSPPPALAESRRLASVSIDSMNLPGVNYFSSTFPTKPSH